MNIIGFYTSVHITDKMFVHLIQGLIIRCPVLVSGLPAMFSSSGSGFCSVFQLQRCMALPLCSRHTLAACSAP